MVTTDISPIQKIPMLTRSGNAGYKCRTLNKAEMSNRKNIAKLSIYLPTPIKIIGAEPQPNPLKLPTQLFKCNEIEIIEKTYESQNFICVY